MKFLEMKLYVTGVVIVVLIMSWRADGLVCQCDDCVGKMCAVQGKGRCYAQIFKLNDQIMTRKRCYDEEFIHQFCDTVSHNVVIRCCDTDFCNEELNVTLPSEVLPTSTKSIYPLPTNVPTIVPSEHIECFTYNSNKLHRGVGSCITGKDVSCYWSQRLAKNGTVIQEKQGCAYKCVPENRNRLIKHCCNKSSCNVLPSRSTTLLSTVSPVPSPISYPPPLSSSLSSVITVATTTTTITITTSTSCITRTTIFSQPTNNPTPNNTTDPILGSSSMSVYIILFVCVIVVYSLITVLLVGLVITICYKQRQINELKNTISQFTHKHENSLRQ